MFRSKYFTVITIALFVFGIATVHFAIAGEKVKAHATTVGTKWHQIEIGDEEGHTIAIFETKGIWYVEGSDEQSVGFSKGIMDFNTKTGQGSIKGYSERHFANGDKMFLKYEGKPVEKGHSKGTYTFIGGTGKFEGITGGGTWGSKSLSPGVNYNEAEGERVYQGQ